MPSIGDGMCSSGWCACFFWSARTTVLGCVVGSFVAVYGGMITSTRPLPFSKRLNILPYGIFFLEFRVYVTCVLLQRVTRCGMVWLW